MPTANRKKPSPRKPYSRAHQPEPVIQAEAGPSSSGEVASLVESLQNAMEELHGRIANLRQNLEPALVSGPGIGETIPGASVAMSSPLGRRLDDLLSSVKSATSAIDDINDNLAL